MKLTEQTRNIIVKKFEYRFKNSDNGKLIIGRINADEDFTSDQLKIIANKLEYGFKKSEKGQSIIQEILNETKA